MQLKADIHLRKNANAKSGHSDVLPRPECPLESAAVRLLCPSSRLECPLESAAVRLRPRVSSLACPLESVRQPFVYVLACARWSLSASRSSTSARLESRQPFVYALASRISRAVLIGACPPEMSRTWSQSAGAPESSAGEQESTPPLGLIIVIETPACPGVASATSQKTSSTSCRPDCLLGLFWCTWSAVGSSVLAPTAHAP